MRRQNTQRFGREDDTRLTESSVAEKEISSLDLEFNSSNINNFQDMQIRKQKMAVWESHEV